MQLRNRVWSAGRLFAIVACLLATYLLFAVAAMRVAVRVREVPTPQAWARASRCLVLSSRECVRRIWSFPTSWRSLDADALLRLGLAD